MTENQSEPSSVYRINKFEVPAEGRDEFVILLESTHSVIRAQQGFIRDLIVEQKSADQISLVAFIELAGADAVERVTAAIAERDKASGLDRRAFASRLGVKFSSWVLAA